MWLWGDGLYFLLFVVQDLPKFPRFDQFYLTAEPSHCFSHSSRNWGKSYLYYTLDDSRLPYMKGLGLASKQQLMRVNFHFISCVFHHTDPRMKYCQGFLRFKLMKYSTMRPVQWLMETFDLIHIPAGTRPLNFDCLWPNSSATKGAINSSSKGCLWVESGFTSNVLTLLTFVTT